MAITTVTTATLTTTSNAEIVAAPTNNTRVYVKWILAGNTSATKTRLDLKEGDTVKISQPLAADGGGFSLGQPSIPSEDYLWKLPLNTALNGVLGGNVTDVRVNVGYYLEA